MPSRDWLEVPSTVPGSQSRWETAFERFESRAAEMAKFRRRLRAFGAAAWPRDAAIVELFCGRGPLLLVLEEMGFTNLRGVDLSQRLLDQYSGRAEVILHDCRDLPFADSSIDIVIVQGGLHHLPRLPEDLSLTLDSVHRVLKPRGLLVATEPWMTPFLRAVHVMAFFPATRRLVPTFDALATMIEEERETYDHWLGNPRLVHRELAARFTLEKATIGFGKINIVGRRRTVETVPYAPSGALLDTAVPPQHSPAKLRSLS